MSTGNPIFRGCASSDRAGSCAKLEVFDWLKDVQNTANADEFVEIRFKNTRKDYYRNVNKLNLEVGDMVAVEANPGHDIGMVSLTGDLVLKQMKRHKVTLVNGEMRKVYRKAKSVDIEKWESAMKREHETMIRSRQITQDLQLNMKIGDVEYQGDGTKAIFYYIADDRVDFRQLIKVLAENFRIRIEMKQIGARQEAGRIGGIGPCGRELCCSTFISNFVSVTTNAARYQEISLNPQKLAGQCSKLKCCLNYEVDSYLDAQKDFPSQSVPLETEGGRWNFIKADIYKNTYWYASEGHGPTTQVGVNVERVKEIIEMNKCGKKPEILQSESDLFAANNAKPEYDDIIGQDSLTRFDKPKGQSRRQGGSRNSNKRRSSGNRSQRSVSNSNEQKKSRSGNENRSRNDRPKNDRSKSNTPSKNQHSKNRPNRNKNRKNPGASKKE